MRTKVYFLVTQRFWIFAFCANNMLLDIKIRPSISACRCSYFWACSWVFDFFATFPHVLRLRPTKKNPNRSEFFRLILAPNGVFLTGSYIQIPNLSIQQIVGLWIYLRCKGNCDSPCQSIACCTLTKYKNLFQNNHFSRHTITTQHIYYFIFGRIACIFSFSSLPDDAVTYNSCRAAQRKYCTKHICRW